MDSDQILNQEKLQAQVLKGEQYFRIGDFENARIAVESALRDSQNPKMAISNPQFQILLNKIIKKSSSPPTKIAVSYFEKAKKLNDTGNLCEAIQFASLTTLYCSDKRKYKEFLKDLLNEKKARDLKENAIKLRNQGYFKEAIETLQAGAALKVRRVSFRDSLKETLTLKKQFDHHIGTGIKFLKGEKYNRAREEISKAAKIRPHSKRLENLLTEANRKEKAHRYYIEGLRLHKQEKNLEAAEKLDTSLDLNPKLTAARFLLKKIRNENIASSYNFKRLPEDTNLNVLSDTIDMLEEIVENSPTSPYFKKLHQSPKQKMLTNAILDTNLSEN